MRSDTGRPGRRRGFKPECRAEMHPRPAVPRRAGGCTTRRGGGALCQIYSYQKFDGFKCRPALRVCVVVVSRPMRLFQPSAHGHRLRPPSKRLLRSPPTHPATSSLSDSGRSLARGGHVSHRSDCAIVPEQLRWITFDIRLAVSSRLRKARNVNHDPDRKTERGRGTSRNSYATLHTLGNY